MTHSVEFDTDEIRLIVTTSEDTAVGAGEMFDAWLDRVRAEERDLIADELVRELGNGRAADVARRGAKRRTYPVTVEQVEGALWRATQDPDDIEVPAVARRLHASLFDGVEW